MGNYRDGTSAIAGDVVLLAGKVRRIETGDVVAVIGSGAQDAVRVEDGDTLKVDKILLSNAAETVAKLWTFTVGVATDDISERTADAGVTVDSVELKDGEVDGVDMLSGLWRIVKKDRVAVTRTNSTTHITDTYTVDADSLGADGGIRGRVMGWYENTSGSNKSFIVKISFGSTVLFQDTDSIASGTGKRAIVVDFEMFNANSTAVQELRALIAIGTNGNATVGYGNMDIGGGSGRVHGSAACTEDTTTDLVLTVELWTSTTASTVTLQRDSIMLELNGT